MSFNKKKFITFFIKNKGISFFDKSAKGKYSRKAVPIYFNWRTISENVNTLEECANYVISFIQEKKLNPDCFIGVPEGATKLAIILQYKWAKKFRKQKKETSVLSLIRGNSKKHGMLKDRDFLGIPKGRVILLEDIIARGGAVIDALKKLKKVKVIPYAVVVLSDRTNGKYKAKLMRFLSKNNIRYYSLSNSKEVVKKAIMILKPSKKVITKLKEIGEI